MAHRARNLVTVEVAPPAGCCGYDPAMTLPTFALRLSVLGCALLLAACGQKGALFLPDPGATPITTTPARADNGTDSTATPDRSNEARKRIH